MTRFSMSRTAAILAALALPSLAMPAIVFAQTAPTAAAAAPAVSKDVEAHISALHDQLQITSAEEGQWSVFAKVMRENAAQMHAAFQARGAALENMTAVENLRSYSQIAQVQSTNMNYLAASFKILYETFPAPQQKLADQVFRAEMARHVKPGMKSATP